MKFFANGNPSGAIEPPPPAPPPSLGGVILSEFSKNNRGNDLVPSSPRLPVPGVVPRVRGRHLPRAFSGRAAGARDRRVSSGEWEIEVQSISQPGSSHPPFFSAAPGLPSPTPSAWALDWGVSTTRSPFSGQKPSRPAEARPPPSIPRWVVRQGAARGHSKGGEAGPCVAVVWSDLESACK